MPLKDTFYSVTPLNWILRGICLSKVYRKGIYLKESKSIYKTAIYVISFGLLNICCLYYKLLKIQNSREAGLVTFNGSVQMTYWFSYFEYIIGVFFVYKHGHVSFIKYFKGFDYIDAILGNAPHDTIRKIVTTSTIFATVIFFINSIFDHICWAVLEGWYPAILYAIDYLYFLLNMFAVLDIISHVIQVEYRLKMIADLLRSCNTDDKTKNEASIKNTGINCAVQKKKYGAHEIATVKNNRKNSLSSLKTLRTGKYLEMVWFSRCYLLLVEQVTYINAIYGFRVLVYCVNLLINMINNLNLAIRIVNGTLLLIHPRGSMTFLPCLSSIMRALNYSVMVVMLMHRCEQVYAQSARILETIDTLLACDEYCYMKTSLGEFRNLLITRPIKFHAARFFTMDYTLLVSLSSTVVTYTIIILQSMQ